jgi:hypothetical protein
MFAVLLGNMKVVVMEEVQRGKTDFIERIMNQNIK